MTMLPKPAPTRSKCEPRIKNFALPADVVGLGNAFITEHFDATDRSVSWSALVEVALRELVKCDDRIDAKRKCFRSCRQSLAASVRLAMTRPLCASK
jgi:hypothetical protein